MCYHNTLMVFRAMFHFKRARFYPEYFNCLEFTKSTCEIRLRYIQFTQLRVVSYMTSIKCDYADKKDLIDIDCCFLLNGSDVRQQKCPGQVNEIMLKWSACVQILVTSLLL